MLKSRRTTYVPLFGETERHPPLLKGECERQKYFDIRATKALILEKYHASIDEEHFGRSMYYLGQIEEQMKYRVLRKRRASLSDTRSIYFDNASYVFGCDVITEALSRASHNESYNIDLTNLLPSS